MFYVTSAAAQMWCLCRLLPLMIGSKVTEMDSRWNNFLQMLEIIDIVFAPIISQDLIAYLRLINRDHHESFIELYPHCRITPKMPTILSGLKGNTRSTVNGERFSGLNFRGFHPVKFFTGKLLLCLIFKTLKKCHHTKLV